MGRMAAGVTSFATAGAALVALLAGCGDEPAGTGAGGMLATGGGGGQPGTGGFGTSTGGSTGQSTGGANGSGGASIIGCDPPPDPGTFYAQVAEQTDASGAYLTQMCPWKGDVLLVVNTAQL